MVALQLPSASSAVDRNDMEDYHHGLMEQEYLRDTHDTFKKGQRPLLVGSGLLGTYIYMLPYLRDFFANEFQNCSLFGRIFHLKKFNFENFKVHRKYKEIEFYILHATLPT